MLRPFESRSVCIADRSESERGTKRGFNLLVSHRLMCPFVSQMSRHSLDFMSFRKSLFLFLGGGDNCDRSFSTTAVHHRVFSVTCSWKQRANLRVEFSQMCYYFAILLYERWSVCWENVTVRQTNIWTVSDCSTALFAIFIPWSFLFIFFSHNLTVYDLFVSRAFRLFMFTELKNFTEMSTAKHTRSIKKICGCSRLLLIWRIRNRFDDDVSNGRRFNFYVFMFLRIL